MSDANEEREQKTTRELLPAIRPEAELVPLVLPEKHQRFYDKLRARIEAFIREKGINGKLTGYLLLAPDLFVLLARLMMDKRVSLQAKAVVGIAVAYFIAPVDFIPEVVLTGLGLMDDIILAVYALRRVLADVDEAVVREHWNGEQDLLAVITRIIREADELVGQKIAGKLKKVLLRK